MSVKRNKTMITAACLAATLTASTTALALDQGDWIGRIGISHISPGDKSDEVPGLGPLTPGSGVEADSATGLSFNIGYMLTDNLAIDVLASLPFKHDIKATGSIAGLGTIGETKQLPPTISLQYHFSPKASVRPYIGAGLNYTIFFDTDTKGALAASSLDLDNSFGLAAQAGVDVDLNNGWFVYGDVRYIDINTDASLDGGQDFEVEIDPWVFAVGVGTTF